MLRKLPKKRYLRPPFDQTISPGKDIFSPFHCSTSYAELFAQFYFADEILKLLTISSNLLISYCPLINTITSPEYTDSFIGEKKKKNLVSEPIYVSKATFSITTFLRIKWHVPAMTECVITIFGMCNNCKLHIVQFISLST